jgi:hypothetical protein
MATTSTSFESVAFIPQLLLSVLFIPIALAKKDLPATMLAQTLAFVTFNKVCTSQYFLWYLIFLPLYLPGSSLMQRPRLGLTALALWVLGQAAWLQQGYQLEFLGRSAFVPGLFASSLAFFAVNCWILGIIVHDVVQRVVTVGGPQLSSAQSSTKEEPTLGTPRHEAIPLEDKQASTPRIDGVSTPTPKTSHTRKPSNVDISAIKNANLGPRNRVLRSN